MSKAPEGRWQPLYAELGGEKASKIALTYPSLSSAASKLNSPPCR